MTKERTIPSSQPKSVATVTLFSDGNQLPRTYQILSVTVNIEINRIPSATVIVLDGEPSKQSFTISNQADFAPGKEIEIKTGYRSDEQTIFKGIVVKHGIKSRKTGSVLAIECKDIAIKMTGSCKSRYFHDVKDSDCMEELINPYGLQMDIASTTVQHSQIVQYNSTDWDMMQCRAEANGFLTFVKNGKITVKKPEFGGETVLTVLYGATVHELDAEIDARLQFLSFRGTAWNYSDLELSDSIEASDPGVPDAGNLGFDALSNVIGESEFRLFHGGKVDDAEMQAWLDGAFMRYRLAKIRGRVTIDGTAVVEPGKLIQLKGTGERFEGKLYVTGVQHSICKGDWQTVIQFGVNPEWFVKTYDVEQPLAGGMLPAIHGLHSGIVTQLEGDPDSDGRIKVRIPVIHKDDEGAWSRLATLDAGKDRGTCFRPEIDDEVIVGFVNDDPRCAVILGMLHSGKNTPPLPLSDSNNVKGYTSRNKIKITFDDEKKSLQIETPGGNKVLLSDDEKLIHLEDLNGNKIIMNTDGITMESCKDLIIKGANDIKMNGTNLDITASSGLKASGSGGCELSLSGSANLKGSVVNIN